LTKYGERSIEVQLAGNIRPYLTK